MGWLELEKFLYRATGRMWWSLNVQETMKEYLNFALERKI